MGEGESMKKNDIGFWKVDLFCLVNFVFVFFACQDVLDEYMLSLSFINDATCLYGVTIGIGNEINTSINYHISSVINITKNT